MHIKKLKHCCMLIDVKAADGKILRIMTDPGFYSVEEHDKVNHADIILITHEHGDHFHIESLKAFLKRSPDSSVFTNDTVGDILAKEGIAHHVMKHGDAVDHKGVHIEAYGEKHAILHKSIPQSSNVGFFLENKLFFPGDAFTDPKKSIDVLALPTSGPWQKMSEPIDYALDLKPRVAFPVHDAMGSDFQNGFIGKILSQNGVEFLDLPAGGELDIG